MRRSTKRKKPIDKLTNALINTLSIVYSHFYFPVYSNGLKSVAGYLGYSWSDKDASGAQSIAWRMKWERTRDDTWKQKLVLYNQEDCAALCKVTDFLRDASTGSTESTVPIPPPIP